jgi:flavin reductase (DIM6/NTAB) family NADH-FMN oxidoreductase RutF
VPKRDIGTNGFTYPMPMALVGSDVDGKPTFMPVAWLTRCRYDPPTMAVAMNRNHVTNRGIREHGEFGLSIPGRDLLQAVDWCGLVSARSRDKSRAFHVFQGRLGHAPMVSACPVAMECRVIQTVDLDSHELFLGEIVAVWADEDVLDTKGQPDIRRVDPFMLTMPDNRYWTVGEQAGEAWSAGRGWMPPQDLVP